MEILISLLVAVLILGLLYYLITMLPLPAPFALVARVIFIVICILVLLWYFAPFWHGSLRL
ncbi:hypothetical protein [Paraburkholderia sp. MM6662-R1]|uniref:hypothetical protein n=1 Tax=Paraburkholderia sp. MM6662-R1 TaxID=2991066 RepID=UPI003D1F5D23